MRNLGDLNDLYNAQDVILLTEIIESRFQAMENAYDLNPRKCNFASSIAVFKEKCLKSFLRFQQTMNMPKFLNKLLLVDLVV